MTFVTQFNSIFSSIFVCKMHEKCNSKILIERNLSQYFGLHKLLTLFWRFFAQILVTLHEIVHVCAHNAH